MSFKSPLAWPVAWPRMKNPQVAPFSAGWTTTINELQRVLDGLHCTNIVISSNMKARIDGMPNVQARNNVLDAGVALYFSRNNAEVCIPCDKFNTVDGNLRAIGLTLEYIRRMEKYGTSQMVDAAFRGFTALPASIPMGPPSRPWHEVLEVLPTSPHPVIRAAYRTLSGKYHPDNGETGNSAKFAEVQRAYKESGAA
jgi:hypothetical protein